MPIKKKNNQAHNIFLTYSIPMSMVGLWPLAENTLFRKVKIVFCLFQMLLTEAGIILHIIKTCNSPSDFMDAVIILSFGIMIFTKISSLIIFKEKFVTVLNSTYVNWSTTENEQDMKIMKDYLKGFNRITFFFYGISIPCIMLYFSRPFILGVSAYSENIGNETVTVVPCNYIFPSHYIFDKTSEFFYRGMLFNQIIQVMIASLINVSTDLMFISIMSHLCGQIEILIRNMNELGKISQVDQYLDNIFKRHQQLMSLVYILEDIFNKIIFIQMILGLFFVCFGGMSILLNFESGDTVNLVKCLMIVGFMLMQSYLYTYPADNLANLGEKMLRGLYSSYWYEMPNRLTKNLVFMMMRLNIPPYLTAGKFFYLTRISYTSVLKTGASYLSVLRIFLQRN